MVIEDLIRLSECSHAGGYAGSNYPFLTQKERDNETGLDYFGARYYSSVQGRFTGADPASLELRHLVNPQDLNRYAYVANNPLKFIDPDGEEKIQVVIQTFIPQKEVTVPVVNRTFGGDDRNVGEPGGFRTQQIINIETDPNKGGAQAGPNQPRYWDHKRIQRTGWKAHWSEPSLR